MKVSEENYFVSSRKSPADKIFFKRLIPVSKNCERVILFFHDARLHSDVFDDFLKKTIKQLLKLNFLYILIPHLLQFHSHFLKYHDR